MHRLYLRNPKILILCLLLAALAAFAISKSRRAPDEQRVAGADSSRSRKPAPNFTLTDAAGSKVSLSDLRGKVVLLNYWATWCGPCVVEIPWFEQFQQQYKSKGFEVVGVSMDEEGWPAIKPFIAEHKMNYRILLGDDSVSQLYGGLDSLPTTFIIDREGRFAFPPHIGLISKNEYVSEIENLLEEKPLNASRGAPDFSVALLRSPAK